MKRFLSLFILVSLILMSSFYSLTVSAASETVTFDYAGSCDWLIEVKNPETPSSTTSSKTFVISAVAVEGTIVTLYALNSETNLYEKIYVDEVALESAVGASGLYAQQIPLKEGMNNIMVYATNGVDDEAVRLEINLLNESFLDKIKSFTVEITTEIANTLNLGA